MRALVEECTCTLYLPMNNGYSSKKYETHAVAPASRTVGPYKVIGGAILVDVFAVESFTKYIFLGENPYT